MAIFLWPNNVKNMTLNFLEYDLNYDLIFTSLNSENKQLSWNTSFI